VNLPLSPCGRAVDMLRSCYSADMQFFYDSPVTLPIVWYFVPDNRETLPFATVFASRIYERGEEAQLPIGELYSPVPWRGGQPPGPVAICGKCGDAAAWSDGVSILKPFPDVYPGTNVPVCCCPPGPQFFGGAAMGGVIGEPFFGEAASGGRAFDPFKGEAASGGVFFIVQPFAGEAASGGRAFDPFKGEAASGGSFILGEVAGGGAASGGIWAIGFEFAGGASCGGDFTADYTPPGGCLSGHTLPDEVSATFDTEDGPCFDLVDTPLFMSAGGTGYPVTGQTVLMTSNTGEFWNGVEVFYELNCDESSGMAQWHVFSADGTTLYASSDLAAIDWTFGFNYVSTIEIPTDLCPGGGLYFVSFT